jgi:hypothetical protein
MHARATGPPARPSTRLRPPRARPPADPPAGPPPGRLRNRTHTRPPSKPPVDPPLPAEPYVRPCVSLRCTARWRRAVGARLAGARFGCRAVRRLRDADGMHMCRAAARGAAAARCGEQWRRAAGARPSCVERPRGGAAAALPACAWRPWKRRPGCGAGLRGGTRRVGGTAARCGGRATGTGAAPPRGGALRIGALGRLRSAAAAWRLSGAAAVCGRRVLSCAARGRQSVCPSGPARLPAARPPILLSARQHARHHARPTAA